MQRVNTAFAGLHNVLPVAPGLRGSQPLKCALSSNVDHDPKPLLITRRSALSLAALVAVSGLGDVDGRAEDEPPPRKLMLPPLPYGYNALEPAIDTETMILHHDKHFAKYTEGTNAALAKIPGGAKFVNGSPAGLAEMLAKLDSVEDAEVRRALRNNGGGFLNHFQFFATMTSPDPDRASAGPDGDIGNVIAERFGGFDAFQEEFTAKSLALFGSGFVYLIKEKKDGGNLVIKQYANQDNPVMDGDVPLLGIDLWEHAYYKKYGNRRDEYIKAWWTVVNWDAVRDSFQYPGSKS